MLYNRNNWSYEIKDDIVEIDIGKCIIDSNFSYLTDKLWDIRLLGRHNKKACLLYYFIIGRTPKKGYVIDHINQNPLDNTESNLREITYQQNSHNKRGYKNKSSNFKGVFWNKINKKWQTNITINKKSTYIGSFDKEEEAALAYDEFARKIQGEFAYLNFDKKNIERIEKKCYFNTDNTILIDFGKLIVDKKNLEKILSIYWRVNITVSIDKKWKRIHECVLLKKDKTNVIDHIDGNNLNNKIDNLRECKQKYNLCNKKAYHRTTESIYKGVYKNYNKWCCSITIDKKIIYLGTFKNQMIAAKIYDVFAKYYYKEYARLNFPNDETINITPEEYLNNKTISSNYRNIV